MKKLQFLAFALIVLLECISFVSCSDDGPAYKGPLIGIWIEDWYDDYIELRSDCSGIWSECLDPKSPDYRPEDPEWNSPIRWTYNDGVIRIEFLYDDDYEEARLISQSDNKIVWKHYVRYPNAYDPSVLGKDEQGYYYLWTWVRFK